MRKPPKYHFKGYNSSGVMFFHRCPEHRREQVAVVPVRLCARPWNAKLVRVVRKKDRHHCELQEVAPDDHTALAHFMRQSARGGWLISKVV